ncbi:hypothetical protein MSG28_003979 [Choristoneura fumiferana]|uniref:Uncharacterized protein n=1 Tax=Choristoneura fumiferana TaxID=7141 RepID=A0ACC0KHY8_CHOFU|nr:hypothetical protein MSG28_003979 [Choristoneura fumiferana]
MNVAKKGLSDESAPALGCKGMGRSSRQMVAGAIFQFSGQNIIMMAPFERHSRDEGSVPKGCQRNPITETPPSLDPDYTRKAVVCKKVIIITISAVGRPLLDIVSAIDLQLLRLEAACIHREAASLTKSSVQLPIYVLLLGTGLLSEQEGLGHSSHAGPVRFAVRLKLISADSLRCAQYVQLDDSTKCGEIQAISHCSHKGITGWSRDLGS